MKIFNQERWNMLPRDLKVSVACRYCALPYFSNLVVQTGLDKMAVHFALDNLSDLGKIKECWEAVGGRWVKCFRYNDSCSNSFIDRLIEELS